MRKSLIITTVLSSFVLSGVAFAATQNATGVIKSIDQKAGELTLADGTHYWLPKGFKANSVKVGEKVAIAFELTSGKNMASSVTAAK